MYANFNQFGDRFEGHNTFDGRAGFGPGDAPFETMPGRHRGKPFSPDLESSERGFHCMPRGQHMRGGHDAPHSFGPGFPPHGMPPHHGGPGMPGGRPPRCPNPEFLQRRIEDADLSELIDMAGRMLRRRPQGGPAQGQALILSILAGREVLSQRELQQMLGIQPGSLSELVSKLESKGLISREKAEDRRGNLLRVTEAGRQAIAAQAEEAPEDDPFAPLSAEQQDQLSAMLRALLTQWVAQLEPPISQGRGGQKPVEI